MSITGANRRSATTRRAPTFRTLILAVVFGVVVVPMGSIAVEADSISCNFGEGYFLNEGSCSSSGPDSSTFDFGQYLVKLSFEGLSSDFSVSIEDREMNPSGGEFDVSTNFEDRDDLFENYECIPLTEGGPCVDFVVSAPSQPGNWTGYEIAFFWNFDTNAAFPNGSGPLGQVRVLHNQSGLLFPGNDYSRDLCIVEDCTYYPYPSPGDPGIRTRDTDFSSFTVAWVPSVNVPEPSTLLLFGAGASGVLCRRRRRSGKPEADSTS